MMLKSHFDLRKEGLCSGYGVSSKGSKPRNHYTVPGSLQGKEESFLAVHTASAGYRADSP